MVDQSGLTGRYDFTLNFTPDAAMAALLGGPPPAAGDNPDAAPDLFGRLSAAAAIEAGTDQGARRRHGHRQGGKAF